MQKIMILALTLMCSSSTLALTSYTESNARDCDMSDAKIEVSVTRESFEPRIIYIQEGDKVCLTLRAIDTPVSMTIDSYPVMASTTPSVSKGALVLFRATKVGEFRIRCRGGCASKSEPKLVVQSKKDFQQFQDEKYREKAEKYRQRVGPKQRQRTYQGPDSSYNLQQRPNYTYDRSRYGNTYSN
jgi:heme/copper-type cytochrome/quinol oxidase subunit 2